MLLLSLDRFPSAPGVSAATVHTNVGLLRWVPAAGRLRVGCSHAGMLVFTRSFSQPPPISCPFSFSLFPSIAPSPAGRIARCACAASAAARRHLGTGVRL
eukprot:354314-Chlamydomonas_euryale.AAC.6